MSDQIDVWDAFHNFHYLCDSSRFKKMYARADLVRMVMDRPGDIIDAGAHKGMSTIEFAHLLETYRPNSNAKVVAFDTFDAAFPDLRENESKGEKMLSAHFDPKALEKLEQAIARNGLQKRVEIVRGDISATLPKYLADNPGFRISLLHCDLDAYAPTRATLETAWPRVVSGGLAVFDNYGIPHWGEADAVDEFFQTLASKPAISTLSSSPTPAAYCIKP